MQSIKCTKQWYAVCFIAAAATALPASGVEPITWEFVVVAGDARDALTDPALDRNPITGHWQVAFSNNHTPASTISNARRYDPGVHLVEMGGASKVVARYGETLPGGQADQVFLFDQNILSNVPVVSLSQGQVAFRAAGGYAYQSEPAPVQGIYLGDGVSAARRVADTSMPLPGNPERLFTATYTPSLSYGRLVFLGESGSDENGLSGVYGDFGNGLRVVVDYNSDPSFGYGAATRVRGLGSYPSVSPVYSQPESSFVTFRAEVAAGTHTNIDGIYQREIIDADVAIWNNVADRLQNFPSTTSFYSPAIDYGGRVAFKAEVGGPGAMAQPTGIYTGRYSFDISPAATVGMPVPGEQGSVFSDFGRYASPDSAPRQVGSESVEHWLAFVGISSNGGVPGVYLRHEFREQAVTTEKLIDGRELLTLLRPWLNIYGGPGPQYADISLFHQAAKDGAVAFRTTVYTPGETGADFIILARRSGPTLLLAPDADTYVRADLQVRQNDNYGLQDFIEIGTGRADQDQAEGAPDKMRALLHFNLSMLPPLDLSSATLETTLLSYDNGAPDSVYTIEAHALLAPWVDPKGEGNGYEGEPPPHASPLLTTTDYSYGVAWAGQGQNSDPYAANNSTQPPFAPAVLGTQLVRQQSDSAGAEFSWNLTGAALAWLSRTAPQPNYGIALIDPTGDIFRGVRFGSREGEVYGLPGAVRGPRLALKWSVGSLPGDLSGDNCIDRDDLAILMALVRGQASAGASLAAVVDLNGDGKVDIADARKLVTLFSHPLGAACN